MNNTVNQLNLQILYPSTVRATWRRPLIGVVTCGPGMQLAQGDSEGERAGRLNTLIPLPPHSVTIGQSQQEARVAERTLMLQVTYWGTGLGEEWGEWASRDKW